jgi:hypothetical protein
MNDEQPKKGMGCFGKGCLALVILFLLLVIGGGVGGWWIYGKVIRSITSDHPANIQIEQPDEAAFQQAEAKLNQLRNAVRNKTETTTEFSAADLNALIARDPAFAGIRGKTRVNMAGDDLILDLSVPLDSVPLPMLKGRWFNGLAQFQFSYDQDQFSFTAHALEANGHRIEGANGSRFSSAFLQSFGSSFTKGFNQSFHQAEERNPQGQLFWNQIKTISVENGQLAVTTQSG